MSEKFFVKNYSIFRNSKEGPDQLSNFTAQITRELIYHDGQKTTTYLEIDGQMKGEKDDEPFILPTITIEAGSFASLGWVAERWGMIPIIFPAPSGERDLRHAIQVYSKPTKKHIYTHTGWTKIGSSKTYLSTTGGIDRAGLHPEISVELPHELRRMALPPPDRAGAAFHASRQLITIGPSTITWPLLLAAYRAAYGPADFSIHLSGRTGTFKSEACALIQAHFGRDFDARSLPANWSSTTNSIEALAYRAKDAILVVDDYIPVGTAYQVRQLASGADRLFRAQGNQAGRSRLTEISSMQTTFYPRGIILSTGEDIPEGHSMRGRMFILELAPGDITAERLTTAQNNKHSYCTAMANWVQWLAKQEDKLLPTLARTIRDNHIGTGHPRTPQMIGDLAATASLLGLWATEMGWMTDADANDMIDHATVSVIAAAEQQITHLQQADPVEAFIDTIRHLLTSLLAHAKTKSGGIPIDAERFGWTKEEVPGQMPTFRANGPVIGWVDGEHHEFLFDPGLITLIKRHSGGKLAITPITLGKRIKEAGMLARTDDTRQRNTVRTTIEGHPRQLMAFRLSDIINDEE